MTMHEQYQQSKHLHVHVDFIQLIIDYRQVDTFPGTCTYMYVQAAVLYIIIGSDHEYFVAIHIHNVIL